MVLQRELQHVVCGIPPGLNITRHVPLGQLQVLQDLAPHWQDDRGGVYNFECQLLDLGSTEGRN